MVKRRDFIRKTVIGGTGVIMLPNLLSAMSRIEKEKRPNLLFVFADQYRKQSLGFLKEDPVHTPNIDALARNGVHFCNAVGNHPLCSPYRGMLMTGKYPLSNGVVSNCHSGRTKAGNYLKKDDVCFSDVLSNNGYNAAYIGKWHLDGPQPTAPGVPAVWDSWCPFDRRHGFDFWYSYGADNNHFHPHYWRTDAKRDEKHYVNQWSPEHEADVINDYFENRDGSYRDNNKPFTLFWSINPPHTPFKMVPDKYKKAYEGKDAKDLLNRPNVMFEDNKEIKAGDHNVDRQLNQAPDYFAMVNGVDEQIGRVVDKLKEEGLYENTIIVFSADHGEMLGSHGLMHKNIWFKEAYEIPFIVHYPKAIRAKEEDLLISVPDYMPTLLGLMGLGDKVPEDLEGKDYSNVFFDKEVNRPDCQLYFGSDPAKPWTGKRGIRTMEYTLAINKLKDGSLRHYLYHDTKDPYQMKNIWGENPSLDEQLDDRLFTLLKEMNDPWLSRV